MTTPHDHLVRKAFADLEVASAFLARVLPSDVLASIDLSTLRQPPASLLGELEKQRFTDVLLEVSRRNGQRLLLRVVLEHQSTWDATMARRLLRYMYLVWDHLEALDPQETKLAPILSIVLYHGRKPWPGSRRLHDEVSMEGLEAAARYIPDFSYLLFDLRRLADVRLAGSAFGSLVMLALKHVADGDLWERLPSWADLLRELRAEPRGMRAITLLLRYMLYTAAAGPSPAVKDFIRANLGEPVMENMRSWADELRDEGIAQGLVKGRVEGRAEATRNMFLHLVQQRFGPLAAPWVERVQQADTAQLETWISHLLSAHSVGELLGD